MLDELERLESAATRGPWGADPNNTHQQRIIATPAPDMEYLIGQTAYTYFVAGVEHREANARLIAAARNALPALLRVARAAAEAADDLEAELRGRYTGILDWPSMRERFERDMQAVEAVRAALTALEGGDQP